jgi:GNAT superfamily N-acetyltransferase
MQPFTAGRQATDRDLDAITETLTLAFADDPVWGRWAFPESARAAEQRRAYFRLCLECALRHRWVRVTKRCEAVASWIPPGRVELTENDERRLATLAGEMLGDHARVFLQGTDLFSASHPNERPHYYLSLLGTRDDHRGKGLGMALLRESLALIDAEGMPAYLESTNPANLFRYERLGFVRVGAFTLPGGGPTVDTMWREPAGAGSGLPPAISR